MYLTTFSGGGGGAAPGPGKGAKGPGRGASAAPGRGARLGGGIRAREVGGRTLGQKIKGAARGAFGAWKTGAKNYAIDAGRHFGLLPMTGAKAGMTAVAGKAGLARADNPNANHSKLRSAVFGAGRAVKEGVKASASLAFPRVAAGLGRLSSIRTLAGAVPMALRNNYRTIRGMAKGAARGWRGR